MEKYEIDLQPPLQILHAKREYTAEQRNAINEYLRTKSEILASSVMDEKFRAPNPRGQAKFPEEKVFEFVVLQNGQPIRLMTYRFPPVDNKKPPRALYIQFHGMGAHANHGAHIAKAFSEAGFCVLAFDHRGYGKSEGLRGYVESLEAHLQDSRVFIDKIEQIYGKEIPKFVSGLSLGGMTSYRLTLEEPKRFRGAILMAPALKNPNNAFLKGIVKAVGCAMPKLQIIWIKKGQGNKNPQIGEEMERDPLTFWENQRPRTVQSIFEGMESYKTFDTYDCPFVYVQGGTDKMIEPDACFELFDKAVTKDKELIFCKDLWHDVWHEKEIFDLLPMVIKWACDRI